MSPPTLLVTAGDPCGIGPEVILGALRRPLRRRARLVVLGDRAVFVERARRLGLRRLPWDRVVSAPAFPDEAGPVALVDVAHRRRFPLGRTSAAAGAASLAYLDLAMTWCRRGLAQGLVTAPVTKWTIQRIDPRFVGHTEYLARAFRRRDVVMLFASDRLRVALISRHLALRRVAAAVTAQAARQTIRMTLEGLRRQFGLRRPRVAVCGLNPHAGERGLFGDEERRLRRVIRAFRRRGERVDGPWAADGFFASSASMYDAVVCGYHDQGLIPFKLLARDAGCQVTLGLPIVRTAPDHGSAVEIAGQGIAHPGSMRYALELAARLVTRHLGGNSSEWLQTVTI